MESINKTIVHYYFLDVDECKVNNGACDHICVNKPGAFECKCNVGYELADDKKKCTGINII